jgi:hypothetical protein
MATICRAFQGEDEARGAVDRLLAAGMAGDEIRVLMGEPTHDQGEEPVGGFAGEAGTVGSFGDQPHPADDGMGTFAGDASEQRRGGFGDIDRETVTTYEDGIRRVRIASHRDVKRMLVDAGLDPATAAADVAALHGGRTLVLVRTDSADAAVDALDATAV